MRSRPVLALALVGVVATTGLAGAATKPKPKPVKPVCNLVTDPAGDVTVASDNLDVVGGDLASDAKGITGVIRVKKLAATDGTAPSGFAYNFRFKVTGSDKQYYLLASSEPSPIGALTFEYGTINATNQLTATGAAKGVLDTAANEVRMTAPLDLGDGKVKPGTKFTDLQAITQRRFVVLLSGSDSTVIDPSKTYSAGAPSCVKPVV